MAVSDPLARTIVWTRTTYGRRSRCAPCILLLRRLRSHAPCRRTARPCHPASASCRPGGRGAWDHRDPGGRGSCGHIRERKSCGDRRSPRGAPRPAMAEGRSQLKGGHQNHKRSGRREGGPGRERENQSLAGREFAYAPIGQERVVRYACLTWHGHLRSRRWLRARLWRGGSSRTALRHTFRPCRGTTGLPQRRWDILALCEQHGTARPPENLSIGSQPWALTRPLRTPATPVGKGTHHFA